MAKMPMTPEVLMLIAERFKALGEPARLQILNVLRSGELTVSEVVEETGLGQANVSRHLQLLHSLNFVTRRKDGLHVFYEITDASILGLCDLMCGRIAAEARQRGKLLAR